MKSRKTIAVAAVAAGGFAMVVLATVHEGEVRTDTSSTVPLDSNSGAFGTNLYLQDRSVAIGENSTAYDKSLVVGAQNYAEDNAFAAGFDNEVWPGGGAAIGTTNTLRAGAHAVALGSLNTIYGTGGDSLVAGSGNLINVAISSAPANSNMVLGEGNIVSPWAAGAERNFVAGKDNTVTMQSDCWLIGEGLGGMSKTLAVGTYNETVTDAAFVVGIGADANNRANGMIIYSSGDVVIPKAQGDIEMGIYSGN